MTCLGKSFAFTGVSTIAPIRAIGVPSDASRVICGGAIGSSDFDKGAVSASQPTSRMKRMQKNGKAARNPAQPFAAARFGNDGKHRIGDRATRHCGERRIGAVGFTEPFHAQSPYYNPNTA